MLVYTLILGQHPLTESFRGDKNSLLLAHKNRGLNTCDPRAGVKYIPVKKDTVQVEDPRVWFHTGT